MCVSFTTEDDVEVPPWLWHNNQALTQNVIVASDDEVLTGVLTGATAGNVYYWTGSALSTSIPSGANANVWRVGVAKNATDLYVDVKPIKKNGP